MGLNWQRSRNGSWCMTIFRGLKLILKHTLPRLIQSLTIFAAFSLMNSSAQSLPAFDHVVVFGDSLSDNGNAGRSSNGPVWVEYLAERLRVTLEPSERGGFNFAV